MGSKLIITGISGRIGAQVLEQALRNPSVSSVIALSRRPFPELVSRYRKLEIVILEDFLDYTADVTARLAGADGCIWCMTTTAGDPVLELNYPKAFADAFAPTLASVGKVFRYVHLTGATVERDQEKVLWVKGGVRKIKGQGEMQMIDFVKDATTSNLWETIIARPGMVVTRGTFAGEASVILTGASGSCIRSDELALALIDAATHGSEQLLLPSTLLQRGRALVAVSNQG